MRILAIISGEYGQRHADNVRQHAPPEWVIEVWQAPTNFPLIIDYPEDYLPEAMPAADLILAFGEHRGVAELLPEIAQMTGAKAVIAAVDNEAWLPRGLARQLRGWLEKINVSVVTPKPLCSLTENRYSVTRRQHIKYDDPLIAEFARYFGRPTMRITVDPKTRFVAEGLVGISADDAEEKAGLLHHHFPCLASMGIDSDFGDTLMHISGNLLRDNVSEQVKPYKQIQYVRPGTRSE
jgi:hypothetical protein